MEDHEKDEVAMTHGGSGGLDAPATSQRFRILLGVFLAAHAAVAICLVDPWGQGWRDPGLTFLILELIFLAGLFAPLFGYFVLRQKKGVRESARAALDTFLDWMGYFTP